jgi:hypothetical protein
MGNGNVVALQDPSELAKISQKAQEVAMARVLLVGYDPETVDYSNPALPPDLALARSIRVDASLDRL